MTRYDELMQALRDATKPERESPPEFAAFLEKVRLHAYKVTDQDVQALKEAGYSEDEIFEHTVAAAAGAGFKRLDAALGTLR